MGLGFLPVAPNAVDERDEYILLFFRTQRQCQNEPIAGSHKRLNKCYSKPQTKEDLRWPRCPAFDLSLSDTEQAPVFRPVALSCCTLGISGLIYEGFWAQRPYYIRLLSYFDA